jgi:hypothetical protein
MNKTRFCILPDETYVIAVGNHKEEIPGSDILAILEAAFDERDEADLMTKALDRIEELIDEDYYEKF